MVRKTVRAILAGGMAGAAVMAAAAPAAAKCGHGGEPCPDPVEIEATVDRPDLGAPIVIRGRDAWRMLYVTGVNYRYGGTGYDEPPTELGPRFDVIYRFTSGDDSLLVYQDLYPYAAGRPFAFTPAGQSLMDRYYAERVEGADGWRGSRALESILRAHGLPEAQPAGTTTSAAGVVALPGNDDAGGPPSWAWLAAGAALLGIAGLTAHWRYRRRSAGTPA
jgi:hypothetical protein